MNFMYTEDLKYVQQRYYIVMMMMMMMLIMMMMMMMMIMTRMRMRMRMRMIMRMRMRMRMMNVSISPLTFPLEASIFATLSIWCHTGPDIKFCYRLLN